MASSLPAQSVDESADDPRRAAKAAAKPAAPSRNSAEGVLHREETWEPGSVERVTEDQVIAPTSASGSTVTVRSGTVRFGEKTVLEGLELSIRSGEFLVVVGRSGCGKSTLLRLIAGLERPASGSVSFDGKPSTGLRSDVRIMFQDARLLPWKSVLDNVRIGVPGGDRDKALEALQLVGLADRANEWPAVLSGGQRQRVALARALASSPRLLLLDEPLGALDALTRIEMQQLIERLWRERGITAVLVTHDVSEAVALADRVILVEQGGITLDMDIALSRPREHDSGFAHYEKLILDRVLTTRTDAAGTAGGYTI